jgi:hypothetical protein
MRIQLVWTAAMPGLLALRNRPQTVQRLA